MSKTIEAIYKDGVIKPLHELNIPEYEHLTLTIKPSLKGKKKYTKDKAFGIWKHHNDIQNSVEWVTQLRTKEENRIHNEKNSG